MIPDGDCGCPEMMGNVPPVKPEDQTYRLRIVSEDGTVEGPELSFEDAAKVLVALHQEGFESVEGWTPDRPASDDEVNALIARAVEIEGSRHCPRCGDRYGSGLGHGPGFCQLSEEKP